MEFQESLSTEMDVQQLKQAGLSREQIANLVRFRALYQREAMLRSMLESRRQAFFRWLYLQGRLES